MKILHVITGLEPGGAESVLERLVRADRSNEHCVVSLQDEGVLGSGLRKSGIAVHELGLSRGRFPNPLAIGRLRTIIRRSRPDIVQGWMYHSNIVAGLAAKAAGVRCVLWNIRRTDFADESLPRRTRIVARLGARLSHVVPDKVIYCAESAERQHAARGYDRRRSIVIHNGVDTGRFSPDAAAGSALRERLGIPLDAALIGCVGRFHPDKDHRTLFEALRLLDEPKLMCLLVGAGMGEDDEESFELATQAGVAPQIVRLGPRTDLPAIMNAIDLHVSSSMTEGFPNVVAEAMACGTPCVSTDVGDAALIVGDAGWVVPAGSPEKLASAIRGALELRGSERWAAMRRAARDRCTDEFSLEKMVGAYQAVWAVACDQPGPVNG